MKFRKVNETTVNCIITPEDLRENGIALDDLFDRKKEAVDFIRRIIMKAADTGQLNLQNEYTSMKLAVLPDHSVSLTLSQDPGESRSIQQAKEKARILSEKIREIAAQKSDEGKAESSSQVSADTFIYKFSSIRDMAGCCRILSGAAMDSSLYRVEEEKTYYLLIERNEQSDETFESRVLSVNEFGRMLSNDAASLAYLKEHAQCILEKDAAVRIANLYG